MKFILRWTIIAVLALIGIGFSNEIFFKKNSVEEVEIEEPVSSRLSRKIASFSEPIIPQLGAKAADFKVSASRSSDSSFNQNVDLQDPPEVPDSEVASGGGNESPEDNFAPGNYGGGGVNSHSSLSNSKTAPNPNSAGSKSPFGASGAMMFSNRPFPNSPSAPVPTSNLPTTSTSSGGTSSSSSSSNSLTCSASVGGGNFGHPIQVSLTCSTVSSIKFCLQEGSCCDPETSGVAYTSPVIIGAEDGNYCLSFLGETETKTSSVVSQSYNISNTYPDLQISFPKIFYQTTELAGLNLLRSNDFSKSGYSVGEINLKSHDPGPSGLNMDCQDIVERYDTLSSPTPSVVFNPLDMLGIALGNQLNVPLALNKLEYGDNFLTSYVVNNSFAAPLYSCSTNKVTLTDFEYFAPEISHGEVGTNSTRVFSASFVSYGFYEIDSDINRTPAGAVNENENGQELRLGSFGVFY